MIDPDKIKISADRLVMAITAWDFIVRLRQTAIFYEGINVVTDEGQLLLAERSGKGLASAGGHHNDKYSPKGIGYGLYSEFGLKLKDPSSLGKEVMLMNDVKFLSKTGHYILPYHILVPIETAKTHAALHNKSIIFEADKQEFEFNTEVALTLSEMRGKRFYAVMPIAELCVYQFNKLKETLATLFPNEFPDMQLSIDDTFEEQDKTDSAIKIPSKTFGRLCFKTGSQFPYQLHVILENFKVKLEDRMQKGAYFIDVSPFILIKALVSPNESYNVQISLGGN